MNTGRQVRSTRRGSWQLHLYKASLRIGLKPLLRFGSVGMMRRCMAGIDIAVATADRVRREDIAVSAAAGGEWLEPVPDADVALLYVPGGAFLARSPHLHRKLAHKIAASIGAAALVARYRLAPRHPFPAALQDVIAAYRELCATPGVKRIVLAGESAGANLALAAALQLRDERSPLPAALVLMSPLADLTFSGRSRKRNRFRDPLLPVQRAHADARHYVADHDARNPSISPVFADFTGLPPMLIQVGANEILLDDAKRIHKGALAAGVHCELDIWRRVPHAWQVCPGLPEAGLAIADISAFLQRILRTSPFQQA